MFLEPFLLMMLLLVTIVILLTPLIIISLRLPKTKGNIDYSHRHYSDYPSDKFKNSFFIHPTNKNDIADIISSLDTNKSVGPYSFIPFLKILYRMKP